MRYIIFLVALISTLMAEKVTLGAGAYMQTQPYKDVGTITTPSPVIFFDNSTFYVKWTRVGAYFLGNKQEDYGWGFSLTAEPRVNQYRATDSLYLTGMSDRESSVEGGVAFSANVYDAYIEVMALTDVLARHDTWIVKSELGYQFEHNNLTFYPSLLLTLNSSSFMNYYYGVNPNEATASRAAYNTENSLQYGVQTYIKYPLVDSLSIFMNIKAEKLSVQATNSPIVEDDSIYSGLVSLIYTFGH
ncbi:MAG: MipA/OmpV family protein [Sulfurimonas sp.]|nr:MipA/OmpV family protein [Sulfurimonas sp.]